VNKKGVVRVFIILFSFVTALQADQSLEAQRTDLDGHFYEINRVVEQSKAMAPADRAMLAAHITQIRKRLLKAQVADLATYERIASWYAKILNFNMSVEGLQTQIAFFRQHQAIEREIKKFKPLARAGEVTDEEVLRQIALEKRRKELAIKLRWLIPTKWERVKRFVGTNKLLLAAVIAAGGWALSKGGVFMRLLRKRKKKKTEKRKDSNNDKPPPSQPPAGTSNALSVAAKQLAALYAVFQALSV